MSDTDNTGSTPAPQGEAIADSRIPSDAAAKPAPAAPAPRISESSFEAAHADLPPLSTLGGNSDAAIVASESTTTAGNGPRRGRGRGAPAGKFGAPGQPAKVAFGVVENPADLTENLSGKHVTGYGDQPQQQREERPRREERKPREAAPATAEVNPSEAAEAAGWKETSAAAEAAPAAGETSETGPKEFVPPVSEGTFKADLNPETERKAREERRQQRDDRPRGDRPQSPGGEFRGEPRPRGEGRGEQRQPRGDRPQGGEFRGDRQPRHEGGQRQERGEGRPQGERRNDHGNNRGEQRGNRGPNRLTIEVPKIPVQEPTSVFGKIKRFIAEKIWGVPASDEIGFTSVSKPMTPHSREWQFGRGQQRRDGRPGDNRNGGQGQRREFRHGNGGQGSQNPNRDGRHRPHARGGNHRDQHGRDGNPRG